MAVQTAFDFAVSARSRPAGSSAAGRPRVDDLCARPAPPVQLADSATDGGREDQPSHRSLELRLAELLVRPVALTLTDNERTMVSTRRHGARQRVRLHHMFIDADELTVRALALFLRDGDARAGQQLEHFVAERRHRIRTRPRRQVTLTPGGSHHDLRALFDALNSHYFDDAVAAEVGWGRHGTPPGKRRKRRSIKLGSYRAADASIRVHPVLDANWVPTFFVEYVVYHEMLHHVMGIGRRDGRRRMHTPEFRTRERGYARYEEATRWERDNLERLLSS